MNVEGSYDVKIYWVVGDMESSTDALRSYMRPSLVCVLDKIGQMGQVMSRMRVV